MLKIRIFFLFFLLITFDIIAEPNFFSASEKQFSDKIKKIKLENGLTVIMMKRGTSPTLALYIKFKVGAVDETPELAGTAHLLEHMLFKGTKNVGTVDYTKEKKYQDQIEVWGTKLDNLRLSERELSERGMEIPSSLKKEIQTFERRLKNLILLQNKEEIGWLAHSNFILTVNYLGK